ncbi:MAG: SEC-C metal-binding domain-containing protein [Acidimicrobiia bacterium]
MTLNRQTLAKIDKQILSQMDHAEGVQLVKVPVSEAVWSTWRRYCEAVGIPMGRALAVLLHQELASVVDEGMERGAELLGDRARRLNEREASLDEREQDLEQREMRIPAGEKRVGLEPRAKPLPLKLAPAGMVPRVGRNDLCPCGSGLKYKRCHGA